MLAFNICKWSWNEAKLEMTNRMKDPIKSLLIGPNSQQLCG